MDNMVTDEASQIDKEGFVVVFFYFWQCIAPATWVASLKVYWVGFSGCKAALFSVKVCFFTF